MSSDGTWRRRPCLDVRADRGVDVSIIGVDTGPDARTGLIARVRRDGATHEVALADLRFAAGSVLGLVVAAYRRWQGRNP